MEQKTAGLCVFGARGQRPAANGHRLERPEDPLRGNEAERTAEEERPEGRIREGRNSSGGPIADASETAAETETQHDRRVDSDPKQARAMTAQKPRRRCGSAVAGAAMFRRWQILPGEVVRDDLRFLANHTFGATIAPFREQAAEFVDHFVCIHTDALGVVADVATREDALRPARQIAVFQRLPEL